MVDEALALARRGWAVFPVHGMTARGCTCGRDQCDSPGKHPLTGHGLKDATTDEAAIEAWWDRWPWANVAVATGAVSGLVVLDVDGALGQESLDDLEDQHAPLPPSMVSITGHGRHHLFAHPGETIRNQAGSRLGPGLDVRGDGGYIVAPPSMHASGVRYAWAEPVGAIVALPGWLLELLREPAAPEARPAPVVPLRPIEHGGTAYGLQALAAEVQAVAGAAQGGRNNRLNRAAFVLGQLVAGEQLDDGVVRTELAAAAAAAGLGEREIANTIESGLRDGAQQPRSAPERPQGERRRHLAPVGAPEPVDGDPGPAEPPEEPPDGPGGWSDGATPPDELTDLRNARRLVAAHGADLRYCADRSQWLAWDGARWDPDGTGEVDRRAKLVVTELFRAAIDMPADQRKKWVREALACESQARLAAMVRCASTEAPVVVRAKELDGDPWLLNVENGTIDLRTGQLRPHRREDLLTKLAPITYDERAEAPVFEAFLSRIFAGNDELIAFVQRALGYALTGSVSEQVLFFLHGAGANGKSTLLGLVASLMGDYAKSTERDLLVARRGEVHPTGVADLLGVRFAQVQEVEAGKRLDESLVKQLTGGDRIRARQMRQDFFEFTPTHKLFFAANHKPVVRGTDHAIWRRIRLVPFEVTIAAEDQDKELAEKLRAEGPGVFAWLVRGCLDWQRHSLGRPPEVDEATAAYRAEMDTLGQFLEDRLDVDPKLWITSKELRKLYVAWCEEQGEYVQTAKALGQLLTERGFERARRGREKAWTWLGLGEQDPMRPHLSNEAGPSETPGSDAEQRGRMGSMGPPDDEAGANAAPTAPSRPIGHYPHDVRGRTSPEQTKGPHGVHGAAPPDDLWEERF